MTLTFVGESGLMEPRFFKLTASYHELMLLLAVHRRGGLTMPLNPQELRPAALEQVQIARLLDERIVEIRPESGGQVLRLTRTGLSHLRMLVIDYHLEMMNLRAVSNEFVIERVRMLERLGCARILLYGASDTARVLLEFLANSLIRVVAVLDDDPRKHGTTMGDVPVVSPARMNEYDVDSVVVTTVAFQDAILRQKAGVIPTGKRLIGLFDDFLE